MKTATVEPTITEGRKVSKLVFVNGSSSNLILHMQNYQYPEFTFEHILKVTDEAGVELEGLWKFGTYGGVRRGRLEFDMRKGLNYLDFHTTSMWCNGRRKNGRKYLISIVPVKPA